MWRLYLLVAIFPIYLVCLYIYNKDKEKEPINFLMKLLFAGILSSILVLIINILLSVFDIGFFIREVDGSNTIDTLIYCFINVALIEEVSKAFMLYLFSYKSKYYDYTFDMIVYGAFVSLGFALFENVLYVFQYGIKVGFQRAVTAIILHACCGVIMGMYLGNAKIKDINHKKSKSFYMVLSVLIPLLIHGMYDYCAFTGSLYNLISIIIIILTISIIFVNYNTARDKKIVEVKEIL